MVLYQTPGHGIQEFLEDRRLPPSATALARATSRPDATEARPGRGENPKRVLARVQILAAGTAGKMSTAPVETARGGEQAH